MKYFRSLLFTGNTSMASADVMLGKRINAPNLISLKDMLDSEQALMDYLDFMGLSVGGLEVMNQVLTELIPLTISRNKFDGIDCIYRWVDPVIFPPSYEVAGKKQDLMPGMARKKSKTYLGDIFISIVKYDNKGNQLERKDNVKLGSIPIYLRSKKCHLYGATDAQLIAAGEDPKDCFQYFIVGGVEKIVLSQEKLATNRIFIMKTSKKDGPVCRLTVETDTSTQVIELGLNKKTQDVLKLRLAGLKKAKTEKKKKTKSEIIADALDGEDLNIKVEKKDNEKRYGSINALHALQLLGFGSDEDGISNLEVFRSYIKEFIPAKNQAAAMSKLFATEIDFKTTSDYRSLTIQKLASKLYNDEYKNGTFKFAQAEERIMAMLDRDLFPHLNNLPNYEHKSETETERLSRVRKSKVTLLTIMIAQMLEHLSGNRPATDRNSWSNKKVDTAGRLFLQLFNAALRKQVSLIKYKDKKLRPVASMEALVNDISPGLISEIFQSSLNTSTWGVKSGNKKLNYARSLNREAIVAGWSDVTRIDVNVDRNGNAGEVQNMHTSSFGYICSVDTPEGENCGLLKNFAITTRVSLKHSESFILDTLMSSNYVTDDVEGREGRDYLMVGANPLGWCYDGKKLEEDIKSWRRTGRIPQDTTVVRDGGWLYVDMSPSRPMRPLLIVNPLTQRLVLDELGLRKKPVSEWFSKGAIEYISPWEQEYIKFASTTADLEARIQMEAKILRDLQETKSDLEEDERLGKTTNDEDERIVAEYQSAQSLIDTHSKDPKNIKESDLMKARETIARLEQRYGTVNLQHIEHKIKYKASLEAYEEFSKSNMPYTHCEIDPKAQLSIQANLIHYPEHNQGPRNSYQANMGKQVLGTYHINHRNRFDGTIKLLDNAQTPICTTIIYSYLGLHQRNVSTHTETLFAALPFTEEDAFIVNKQFLEAGGQRMTKYMTYKMSVKVADEQLSRPRKTGTAFEDKYHAIEDGLPYIGAFLNSGDCVIGKETKTSEHSYIDTSLFVKPGDEGIVDSISFDSNQSEEIVIVKLRLSRVPGLGDKMAASSAQKGTIAAILSDVVMYRDETGTSPSVVTNPSSIPSRMTMSYPTEQFWSANAAFTGRTANASGFYQNNSAESLAKAGEMFERRNHHKMGYHVMMSGTTGELLSRPMNMGLVAFQSLRHHAKDKYQARSVGKVRAINHQPPKGKVKKGGLRIGEMERDVFLSHGASSIVLERLMRTSDRYRIILCTGCGTIVTGNIVESGCLDCGNKHREKFVVVDIPYAIKLLIHYLALMGIRISLGAITTDQYTEKVMSGQGRGKKGLASESLDVGNGEDKEYEDDMDAEQEEENGVDHYDDDAAYDY